MKVVIRWVPQFCRWYLCHAESYQNAFRKDSNGYKTRGEAADFARQQGCEIEKHEHDVLQNYHEADVKNALDCVNEEQETMPGGKPE